MNRREFVKLSTLLVAGSTIPIIGSPKLFASDQEGPFKVGIIGYGDRGSGMHSVMNSMPEKFEVVAICDNLPFRIENAKQTYPTGISFYDHHNALLENKEIDVVLVSTPLYLHFEHAKAVLESGKHLFLEKTMVFNVDEVLALNNLVKAHPNQIVQIGHQYRYSPLYFKVKEMIQNGWLGKVTQIDARWDRNHNWRRPVPSPDLERQINWRMYKEYSGGLVAELLSHQIDFINWAFDTVPSQIHGMGGIDRFEDGRETFDNVQVMLRYNEGMVGNFGATCANQHEGYAFKIKGTKGMVSLLMNEGIFYPEPNVKAELQEVDGVSGATKLTWSSDKKGVKILDEPTRDGSYYALEDYHRCLTQSALPYANVVNAGKTAITVALANQSLYEGSTMSWKDEYNLS